MTTSSSQVIVVGVLPVYLRMDDSIDKVGKAKYVTKFDLLKGFWQVPLTDRTKEISAFATPDGL